MIRKTQIFSIFGQIEEVAANTMISKGKATKIEKELIPKEVLFNDDGTPAAFAIAISGEAIPEFEQLIRDLRM